jgi:hypothetical protein
MNETAVFVTDASPIANAAPQFAAQSALSPSPYVSATISIQAAEEAMAACAAAGVDAVLLRLLAGYDVLVEAVGDAYARSAGMDKDDEDDFLDHIAAIDERKSEIRAEILERLPVTEEGSKAMARSICAEAPDVMAGLMDSGQLDSDMTVALLRALAAA